MADSFDYVIVGAGSAGCVLANRLSAEPSNSVCLIEAGPRDRHPYIHVPAGVIALIDHKRLNWLFSTTPQTDAGGRRIKVPRGRALGGSSSINGMIYMRGHPGDYDEWAEAGNPGWSFAEVLPYFKRAENNETFGETAYHGAGGPLNVTDLTRRNPLVDTFFEATDSLQLPRRGDFNDDDQEGFGTRQVTQRNGRRESAATAYLKPARDRPNLEIVTGGQVARVAFEGKRASAVELADRGASRRIEARREVILSAGAIGTPAILLRSGVGDGAALQALGIDVAHHLPEVGRNLQDHAAINVQYSSPTSVPYGLSLRSVPRLAWGVVEYLLFREGFYRSNLIEAGGFLRTQPGLARADIQFTFLPGYRGPSGRTIGIGHGYAVTAILLRPNSRGTVAISGTDPYTPPAIDPRFFSAEGDLDTLLRGLKMARRILDAPAWQPYRGDELRPGPDVQTDDQLKDFILGNSATVFHPVGTCRMGNDAQSVVDTELRVRGVKGLRVVDGSVMPTIVGGNTNAPIIMIAEKASDMILGRPPLPPAAL